MVGNKLQGACVLSLVFQATSLHLARPRAGAAGRPVNELDWLLKIKYQVRMKELIKLVRSSFSQTSHLDRLRDLLRGDPLRLRELDEKTIISTQP